MGLKQSMNPLGCRDPVSRDRLAQALPGVWFPPPRPEVAENAGMAAVAAPVSNGVVARPCEGIPCAIAGSAGRAIAEAGY